MAHDRADRARIEYGTFSGLDWHEFLVVCGLTHLLWDLGKTLPAIMYDGTVVTHDKLRETETARWVWHEIGHHLMHGGDRDFWLSRPCGEYILAKFERQANEFAALFPDWGD